MNDQSYSARTFDNVLIRHDGWHRLVTPFREGEEEARTRARPAVLILALDTDSAINEKFRRCAPRRLLIVRHHGNVPHELLPPRP